MVADQERADAIFGRRLRAIRQAAGYTQADVAGLIQAAGFKLYRSTIGKMENGDRPVTIGEASGLAAVLGVSLADLVADMATAPDCGLVLAEIAAKRRLIAELTAERDEADARIAAARSRLGELERSLT